VLNQYSFILLHRHEMKLLNSGRRMIWDLRFVLPEFLRYELYLIQHTYIRHDNHRDGCNELAMDLRHNAPDVPLNALDYFRKGIHVANNLDGRYSYHLLSLLLACLYDLN
jgi:hypothetical protein